MRFFAIKILFARSVSLTRTPLNILLSLSIKRTRSKRPGDALDLQMRSILYMGMSCTKRERGSDGRGKRSIIEMMLWL